MQPGEIFVLLYTYTYISSLVQLTVTPTVIVADAGLVNAIPLFQLLVRLLPFRDPKTLPEQSNGAVKVGVDLDLMGLRFKTDQVKTLDKS